VTTDWEWSFAAIYQGSSSSGAALGLRYIMRGGMMLKLSVNHYELDTSGDGGKPTLNAARLELGWTF
jgi:hypothetical protein